MPLPESFPAGTRFADVEGVPVSETLELVCRAWDVPEGRRFPGFSFSHNGTLVSEEAFRAMVAFTAMRPSRVGGPTPSSPMPKDPEERSRWFGEMAARSLNAGVLRREAEKAVETARKSASK